MSRWRVELVAVVAAITGALVLLWIITYCLRAFSGSSHRKERSRGVYRMQQLRSSSNSLGLMSSSSSSNRKGTVPVQSFDWIDRPKLVQDAIEHGWSAFALSQVVSSQVGAKQQQQRSAPVESRWKVGDGSELMQMVKFNPGDASQTMQFMKSALPLPGPNLGSSSYPQEAYLEVSIAFNKLDSFLNGTVLIQQATTAVGLVTAEASLFGVVGSIGYYSSGQVVLNGVPLEEDGCKKRPWLVTASQDEASVVVGCGFNPRSRRVFFTLKGEVVYQVSCSECDEFAYPLHLALLSNAQQLVAVVNLGQKAFEYGPANATRAAEPGNHSRPSPSSFRRPVVNTPQLDSGELFSMGRLDSPALSQDLQRPPPSEAGSELFEIVLDDTEILPR